MGISADYIKQKAEEAAKEGAQKLSKKFELGPVGGAVALAGVAAATYGAYVAAKILGKKIEEERKLRAQRKTFERNSSAFAFSTGYVAGVFPELEGAGNLDTLTRECLKLGNALEKAYNGHSPQMYDLEERYSLASKLLERELKVITRNSKMLLDQRVLSLRKQVSLKSAEKTGARKKDGFENAWALREIRDIMRQHRKFGASYRQECAMAVSFAKDYLLGAYPRISCHALDRLARRIYGLGRMGDNPGVMREWNKTEDILNKMLDKYERFEQ